MATKVVVNGKTIIRPGVYAIVISGIKNNPAALAAGNVLIIDDGLGAGFGGGQAGTAYNFTDPTSFQNFVKGGVLYDLAAPLFQPLPNQPQINGVSQVTLIHARSGTSAVIDFTIAAGDCSFTTIDQGLNANGVEDGSDILRQGYAGTITQLNAPTGTSGFVHATATPPSTGVDQVDTLTVTTPQQGDVFTATIAGQVITYTVPSGATAASVAAAIEALIAANSTITAALTPTVAAGVITLTAKVADTPFTASSSVTVAPGQFVFTFYHGTFVGIDPLNNVPYNGISEANSAPLQVIQSPAVSTLDQLAAWANSNATLKQGFTFNIGTGAILASDVSANPGNILAAGGTENYSAGAWQAAIASATNLNVNFFLSLQYGNANMLNAHNDDLVTLCTAGKYSKQVWIGGGALAADYTAYTAPAAQELDTERAVIVHGDGKTTIQGGYLRRSSLWKAAANLGRECGLAVQTPLTFKQIGVDAEWDPLPDSLINDPNIGPLALGILVNAYDDELGYMVCVEDINTLQNNDNLVNPDGTSFCIQIVRIKDQLNKELAYYLKQTFFSNPTSGPNRNTVSAIDVTNATAAFLTSRTATTQQDNYILSYSNIVVSYQQDNIFVAYQFSANGEVDKMIVTGTLIDA